MERELTSPELSPRTAGRGRVLGSCSSCFVCTSVITGWLWKVFISQWTFFYHDFKRSPRRCSISKWWYKILRNRSINSLTSSPNSANEHIKTWSSLCFTNLAEQHHASHYVTSADCHSYFDSYSDINYCYGCEFDVGALVIAVLCYYRARALPTNVERIIYIPRWASGSRLSMKCYICERVIENN